MTLQEWRRIPPERRAELFDGRLFYQGMPGRKHGYIQGRIFVPLVPFDAEEEEEGEGSAPQKDRPGGWWFSLETDISLLGNGLRPDVLGWRTDRYPEPPVAQRQGPYKGLITDVPDWTCEVLSKGSKRIDLGRKREVHHQAGVAHYWVVDPRDESLTILRRAEDGYVVVLVAGRGDVVRAEPFAAVELRVSSLFGRKKQPRPA